MAKIFTRKREIILVDDEDFVSLNRHRWCIDDKGYVVRRENMNGKWVSVRMHRKIMDLPNGDARQVDHINGQRADNRKENLRICMGTDNQKNRRKGKNNVSGFKGVIFDKKVGRWRAYIQSDKKWKHLGYFGTAEDAHEFYCLAADMLHGEFANYGAY